MSNRREGRGTQGKAGKQGLRGKRGASGTRGVRGLQGPAGPPGPRMKPAEVLPLVEDQFYEIRKQLGMQLERFGQLQAQLDQIHRLIKSIVSQP